MSSTEQLVRFAKSNAETQRQLIAFAEANPPITHAVLATEDGLELAGYPARRPATGRIAAMSSSLHALSEALMREAGLVEGRSLIVEAESGIVLIQQVPGTRPRVSLAVVATGSGILGQLLWASRNCCASLRDSLSNPAE
jgi:predicted regulator of Ras-like GTPase activity (Roadblock/LC7/MglB family)